jgi:hypothetical protein
VSLIPILAPQDPDLLARSKAMLAEPMAGLRMTQEHIDLLTTLMGVSAARMYATLKARSANGRAVLSAYVSGRQQVRLS